MSVTLIHASDCTFALLDPGEAIECRFCGEYTIWLTNYQGETMCWNCEWALRLEQAGLAACR